VAEFKVYISRAPLRQLLASLNRSMLWIFSAAVVIAALIGIWLSRQITQPLRQLADQAEAITLYQFDLPFRVRGSDEVGLLGQAFRRMIFRLRRERLNLQAAEQQATLAEIARQVNHDIKNGFLPIRNVMRHWDEVAREMPEELPAVFAERKKTVLDSLAYLEELARNYAGLKPDLELKPVNLNDLVAEIAPLYQDVQPKLSVRSELAPALPPVSVDPIQMRRVIENLLRNAVEALSGRTGEVCLRTLHSGDQVILEVIDNGPGMSEEMQQRIFEGFYSTKKGTGLGLLNVRRIVQDFGGRLRIDSAPGKGTTVTIELPSAK
jgi:signal transduction histidine kinase